MSRVNGSFTEFRPTHTKTGYTRNNGKNYKAPIFDSIGRPEHRHSTYGTHRSGNRTTVINNYYNCEEHKESRQPSFGKFLLKAAPFLALAAALLLGKSNGNGLTGLLSKLFGGNATNTTNDTTKAEAPKTQETRKTEEPPKTAEAPKTQETPKAEEAPKIAETPKTQEAPKAEETIEHTVKKGDTIFTIIQEKIKEQNPNATKDEILELTKKTIEANKELLEGNNARKPIYQTVGDYIEIGDVLKLVLK